MQVPIEDTTALADSSPEEAAKNIDNSNVLGVDPSQYKREAPIFDKEVSRLRKPATAEPGVAKFMEQSTEHAALASEDAGALDYLERQIKLIGDHIFDRPSTEHKIRDLSLKKMKDPGAFSTEQQFELDLLNEERESLNKRNYGLDGPFEQMPAQIIGGIVDFARTNIEGAIEGIGEFQPKSAGGLGLSAGIGIFKRSYEDMVGATYNESSYAVDEKTGEPKNIDEETKKNIAHGVGIISSAMNAAVGATLMRTTPFLSKFLRPQVGKIIVQSPAMAAVVTTLGRIASAGAVGAGAADVTELTRIVGEEMGQNYDGTEASFMNALYSTVEKLEKPGPYRDRLVQAGTVGAGVAGTLATASGVLGFKSTKNQYQMLKQAHDTVKARMTPQERDVTPAPAKELTERSEGGRNLRVVPNDPQAPNPSVTQAVKALQTKEALLNVSKVAKSTKMSQVAPGQLTALKEMLFNNAGIRAVYFGVQDLKAWAKDEARGEAARGIIDSQGVVAAGMEAPIKVEPHKFMELVREYPDLLDYAKMQADAPNPNQAEAFLQTLQKAQEKRTEVLGKLGIKPEEVPPEPSNVTELPKRAKPEPLSDEAVESMVRRAGDIQASLKLEPDFTNELQAELDSIKKQITQHFKMGEPGTMLVADWGRPLEEVSGEKRVGYLTEPTFTEAIKSIIPEAEVEKIDSAQMEARANLDADIQEAAELEMLQVQDIQAEHERQIQFQIEQERIKNDPSYAIVDKFRREVIADSSGKKTLAFYAIDPSTLPDNLLKYLDHHRLKEHRVFVKGGRTADESAQLLGLSSGEELLKVLSSTPSREVILKARMKAMEAMVQERAKDSVDLNHINLIKSYDNRTLLNIREMKFMREQKWPATKAGIKRIALPLPSIEKLESDARTMVMQTKVGDLNINQFKVGERQTYRTAVKAILKNEIHKAFVAKEASALNIQMQKHTAIAIGQGNRILRFARRFDDPEVMREIKNAGETTENAVNELLDLFNLNPSRKGTAIQGSYQRWVKKMVDGGLGNFEINPALADVRQSAADMTTEALLAVGDRLKVLYHHAKMSNKLFAEFKKEVLIQTEEAIAQDVHKQLNQHPNYDETRVPSVQEPEAWEKHRAFFSTANSMMTAIKHIASTLDQEKSIGYFYELLVEPLTGEGKFKNKQGFSRVIDDQTAVLKHLEETKNAFFDPKEWRDLRNTWLDIPEFEKLTNLNRGRLLKSDLLVMALHYGDPDGRVNLEKMGTSLAEVKTVLERHLDHNHIKFVHNFYVNGMESFWGRTVELEKRSNGRDVTKIQGVPYEFKGVMYPGGHKRQRYAVDFDAKQIAYLEEVLEDKSNVLLGLKDGKSFARNYAAEMTEQGRVIDRVGSGDPLDLSFAQVLRDFEEVIHDLNYREPTQDLIKILKNPIVKKAIISTVGLQNYRILLGSVGEVASQIEAENSNYFSDQTRFAKLITGNARSGFSVARIGANVISMFIQPLSVIVNTMPKMGGLKGAEHLINATGEILFHLPHYFGFKQFAESLDASLRGNSNEVADTISSTFYNALPSRNLYPKLAPLQRGLEATSKAAMGVVQVVDDVLKTIVARASFNQFLAGDVEDFPLERVQKMSKQEQYIHASRHAAQMSDLTLTRGHKALDRSAWAKNPRLEFLSYFMNDARQTFNNQMAMGRKVKWKTKDAYRKFKEGDYEGAKKSAVGAAGVMMTLFIASAIGRLYEEKLRGQPNPFDNDYDWHTLEGQEQAAKDFTAWFVTAPLDIWSMSTPLVREVHFAADVSNQRKSTKKVGIPITDVLTAVATTYNALKELLIGDREGLNEQQVKQFMLSIGYMIPGGAPTGAIYKLKKGIEGLSEVPVNPELVNSQEELKQEIQEYQKNPPEGASNELMEDLEKLSAQLTPKINEVPPDATQVLKFAMSGGDWTKKDPNSSAAGLFQFTEERWKEMMILAPELGLTENGRVSKDPLEQELAVEWSSQQHTNDLIEAGVPVDMTSILGSHLLGSENYIKVHKAPANTKLKTVLGANSGFDFRTVGQLKEYINQRLVEGRKLLTLTVGQTED